MSVMTVSLRVDTKFTVFIAGIGYCISDTPSHDIASDRMRERDRETERQTDRQRWRDRDRERYRER